MALINFKKNKLFPWDQNQRLLAHYFGLLWVNSSMVLNFELIFYMHGDMDEASPYEKSEVNLEAPNNSYIFFKKSQKLAEIFGLM